MYEMKHLTNQDMPYFQRLAEEGKAIIIELSDQALLQIEPESFRKLSGEIDRVNLEETLLRQKALLMEKSSEGHRLYTEFKEMEHLLQDPDSVNTDRKETKSEAEEDFQTEQMKKMIEEMIKDCMHEINAERNGI